MRLNPLFPLLLFFGIPALAQHNPLVAPDSLDQMAWGNTRYNAMDLEERIGQLFMASVASNQDRASTDKLLELVRDHGLGGIIFMSGHPVKQAQLANRYQAGAKVPLLIGLDGEWGLAMRLDATYAFPWNMTLGAIRNNDLVEKVGRQIGGHAKRLGVHINFAPVLDVNNNPLNPIIGNRSFGEDPVNVALKGAAFVKGMESAGVLASGKHFPGHGDTATDSHKALPTIGSSRALLDSIELVPFQHVMDQGLSSIMVAHLELPALESRPGHPSSLSRDIVTGLLQREMGFEGLIVTDRSEE